MRTEEGPWICVRQRAGPLVKECRALRPRIYQTDSPEDRRDKREIVSSPHSAVCRSCGWRPLVLTGPTTR